MPQPGDRLGEYRLLYELGQGGMATVFAAEAVGGRNQGAQVACKMLLPHLRKDPRWLAQFAAEARTTASIRHPNVVKVLEVPADETAGYFITELCEGVALDKLLATHGALPADTACALLSQLARGLHAAHITRSETGQALNIVHRDISPHNVLVGFNGDVVLLDFGIAAADGNARLTRTGELKGKLAYLAPEQITRSHEVNAKTDLWAFGVVAYELLTGVCLFAAADEASTLWNVTAMDVPSLRERLPTVPNELAQLVLACLQRDPSQRPADALELADAFGAFARDSSKAELGSLVRGRQPSRTLAASQGNKRFKLAPWVAGAAALGFASLLVGVASQKKSGNEITTTASLPPAVIAVAPPGPLVALNPKAAVEPESVGKQLNPKKTLKRLDNRTKETHPALVSNPYHDLVFNPY
jgi:eukaryotic-like serine/threonine-protein kinase